jgi:hypothetical protein
MDFDELEKWYDGYSIGDEPSMFNPNSVMQALDSGKCKSYWGKTGAFDVVANYIQMNYEGLKDDIIRMLAGERCAVDPTGFQNDMSIVRNRDDVLTVLIHLGYLSYNVEEETATVPNKEIRIEFVEALRGSKTHKKLSAMVKLSDRLMRATLDGDEQQVAEVIEHLHQEETSPQFYNNEQALRSVLKLGYISAIDKFISIQELPTGKGYADLVFIPRTGGYLPAVVVELKWNKTEHAAIEQIKERNYPDVLKRFTDNILLVGISYDETTKQHTCKIEKYAG